MTFEISLQLFWQMSFQMMHHSFPHAVIISGKLRCLDNILPEIIAMSKNADIIVATDTAEIAQASKLVNALSNVSIVYTDRHPYFSALEAQVGSNRGLHQWIKYLAACQLVIENESKRGFCYSYVHKIRTDCSYRSITSIVSKEHESHLDSFNGILAETDYTWSGRRDYCLSIGGMLSYANHCVIPSEGFFRIRRINLSQFIGSSGDSFWKYGSFITMIREESMTDAAWHQCCESLASCDLHGKDIRNSIIRAHQELDRLEPENGVSRLVSSSIPLEDQLLYCESDSRAARTSHLFFRFIGSIQFFPSEVAFSYYLNIMGISVGRSPVLRGFLLKDRHINGK